MVVSAFEANSSSRFLVSFSGLSDGTNEYLQVVRLDNPLGATNLLGAIGFGLAFAGALLIVWLLIHAALAALRDR